MGSNPTPGAVALDNVVDIIIVGFWTLEAIKALNRGRSGWVMPGGCYHIRLVSYLLPVDLAFFIPAIVLIIYADALPSDVGWVAATALTTAGGIATTLLLRRVPSEAWRTSDGVLLAGAVQKRHTTGEVLEQYTTEEVREGLKTPLGLFESLECFVWRRRVLFRRRTGNEVEVEIYAGSNCDGKWLLLRKREEAGYLLVCVP